MLQTKAIESTKLKVLGEGVRKGVEDSSIQSIISYRNLLYNHMSACLLVLYMILGGYTRKYDKWSCSQVACSQVRQVVTFSLSLRHPEISIQRECMLKDQNSNTESYCEFRGKTSVDSTG